MPLIRRYLPSGLTQRIFFTLNFASDSHCGLESGKVSIADSRAVDEISGHPLVADIWAEAEAQRRWLSDVYAGAESWQSVGADSYSRAEASAAFGRDFLALGEINAVFRTDLLSASENQSRVLADRLGYTEVVGTRSYDGLGLLEGNRQVVADVATGDENITGAASAVVDAVVAVESVASWRRDSFGQAENQANVTLDRIGLAEAQAVVTKDQSGGIEYVGRVTRDWSPAIEAIVRLLADVTGFAEAGGAVQMTADTRQAYLEARAGLVADARGQGENLAAAVAAVVTADAASVIELLAQRIADGVAIEEFVASIVADRLAQAENIRRFVNDGTAIASSGNSLSGDFIGVVEKLGGVVPEARSQQEATAIVSGADASGLIELLHGLITDTPGGAAETRRAVLFDTTAPLDSITALLGRVAGSGEEAAVRLAEVLSAIEAQSLSMVRPSDTYASLEIAGMPLTLPAVVVGLSEFGQVGGNDTLSVIETQAISSFPFDPDGAVLIDGPYLVLDRTHTAISSSRVRIITVPYASLALSIQPFDPIATNTLDVFAFDFTLDAAGATITATTWAATFDPGFTAAVDDTPQARVIGTWPTPVIFTVNPFDNSLQTWNGQFSAALIGTFPASAAGGTYTLTATISLSDLRVLQISTTVLCVARQA